MRPMPEACIAPEIAAQQSVVTAEREKLASIVSGIQSRCEHRIVSEAPYRNGLHPRRICNHCRLEEEGGRWSGCSHWSRSDHESPILGNSEGRILVTVDRNTLYEMRV